MKPNLFIVGKPKSGTSALVHFLNQHKDAYVIPILEPGVFHTDLNEQEKKYCRKRGIPLRHFYSKKEFLDMFKGKEKKILGDKSTGHILSKVAAKNIYEFNPDAKIIIMLREPVEFMYSLHAERYYDGTEDVDFAEAIAREPYRKKGQKLPKYIRGPYSVFYLNQIRYAQDVKRYINTFPSKNIMIIIFEDFRKDNKKAFLDVLKFLGIKNNSKIDFRNVNVSKKVGSQSLKRFFEHPYVWCVPKKILSRKSYEQVKKFVLGLVVKNEKRPPMNPALRKELMKKALPEVKKISKLLDRDLVSVWGYDKLD